jgi:uncharacterized protein YkwD
VLVALLACAAGAIPAAPASASAAAPPAVAPCPGAGLRPDAADARAVDAATLCLVNRVRAAHHLHGLHGNAELAAVAASQVSSMLRRNYFADIGPGGQTPLSLVGRTRYPARAGAVAVGQNLAWGTGGYSTPAHVVAAWMASTLHREIMLTAEYRDVGVAVGPSIPSVIGCGRAGATYAIEFGVRLP